MSKFRNLYPESHSFSTSGLTTKLERALILCEILNSPTSKNFLEYDNPVIYVADISENTCSIEKNLELKIA